jgi:DNA-binding transcriptional MerR regulator
VAERSHLSIGEVLSLLREEFPDVTISKIRFLESQGLVDPERTPSGYRKFYEHDVERLRWILRQQRENFLPLKIIRGRLTEQGDEGEDGEEEERDDAAALEAFASERDGRPAAPALAGAEPGLAPQSVSSRASRATVETAAANHPSANHPAASTRPRGRAPAPAPATTPGRPAPAATPGRPAPPAAAGTPGPAARATPPPASTVSTGTQSPGTQSPGNPSPGSQPPAARSEPLRPGTTAQGMLGEDAESYSDEELAAAGGGTVALVKELQQFGLIATRTVVGGTPYFDTAALDVVRAAAGLSRHGIEARHLRAWRNAADREAGLFEQVIMPLLRQRNPEARRQAATTLAELAALGGDLRTALMDHALRQIH